MPKLRPDTVALRHGQMHLYPPIAREGAPKRLTVPALATGMVRQTKPSHEFLHGAPLDDEPLQKNWHGKGNVPTHAGMTKQQVSNTAGSPKGDAMLQEAGRLGAPVGGWKR
jgi:hypothetical protein